MAIGQSPKGATALMILSTESPVPPAVLDQFRAAPGILDVHAITS
jgi:hypothetical protein